MTEAELWEYFLKHQVTRSRPFDRDFIWIAKADFPPIQDYFSKEFNLFHSEKSFRSKGLFSHIHILDQGEYIFAHKDIGNLRRFFPLGLLHLFFDVIPYAAFALIQRKSFNELFTRAE